MTTAKAESAKELHRLLIVWHQLEVNPNATGRDFMRVGSQIRRECDYLDAIEAREKAEAI